METGRPRATFELVELAYELPDNTPLASWEVYDYLADLNENSENPQRLRSSRKTAIQFFLRRMKQAQVSENSTWFNPVGTTNRNGVTLRWLGSQWKSALGAPLNRETIAIGVSKLPKADDSPELLELRALSLPFIKQQRNTFSHLFPRFSFFLLLILLFPLFNVANRFASSEKTVSDYHSQNSSQEGPPDASDLNALFSYSYSLASSDDHTLEDVLVVVSPLLEPGRENWYSRANHLLGVAALNRGLYKDAVKHFETALAFETGRNKRNAMLIQMGISESYWLMGNMELALMALPKRGIKPKLLRSVYAAHSGNIGDALIWANSVFEYAVEKRNIPLQVEAASIISVLSVKNGQSTAGFEWALKSLTISENSPSTSLKSHALVALYIWSDDQGLPAHDLADYLGSYHSLETETRLDRFMEIPRRPDEDR